MLHFFYTLLGNLLFYIFFTNEKKNIFYKNFNYESVFCKRLIYQNNFYINVRITSYWDYWRMFNYEKHPVKLIEDEIKNGTNDIVYYEIGSNIGYSAILIAKMLKNHGTVYAIEIEPANFKTLSDNIALNNLRNIIPLQLGLSSKERIAKFYYNIYHSKMNKKLPVSAVGAHSINFDEKLHDKEIYFNVPLISFDKMIEAFNLLEPTHVFIDTHGAEYEILESMKGSLDGNNLNTIIIDIEDNQINKVEDSKVYNKLENYKFYLEKTEFEAGSKNMSNSYKATFRKRYDK